jgi:hypothetical protein
MRKEIKGYLLVILSDLEAKKNNKGLDDTKYQHIHTSVEEQFHHSLFEVKMSRGVIFTKKFIVKLYIFLKPLFLWKTVVFGGRVFLHKWANGLP